MPNDVRRSFLLTFTLLLLGLLATSSAAGCADETMACTLAACLDSLEVEFVDEHDQAVMGVKGTLEFGGHTVTFDCGAGSAEAPTLEGMVHCTENVLGLLDKSPDEARLTLDGVDLGEAGLLKPEYSTNQPNGPGCGPTCRQGRVKTIVPSMAEND